MNLATEPDAATLSRVDREPTAAARLEAVSTLIRGTARTPEGLAVEPFDVTLLLERPLSTSSDGQGRFTFRLDHLLPDERRDALLQVRACGFLPFEQTVALHGGQDRELTVILQAGGDVLSGRVVDEQDRPVAGARVVVTSRHATAAVETARTDAEGVYAFRCASSDDVLSMRVLHPAFLERVVLPAAGGWQQLVVVLEEGCELEGTVLDAWGRPAAGIRVQAVVDEPGSEEEARFEGKAVSDVSGHFTLGSLPPGVIELAFWTRTGSPGARPTLTEWVAVGAHESASLSVSLPPDAD